MSYLEVTNVRLRSLSHSEILITLLLLENVQDQHIGNKYNIKYNNSVAL